MRVTKEQIALLNSELGHEVYGMSISGSNLTMNRDMSKEYATEHSLKKHFNSIHTGLSQEAWDSAKAKLEVIFYRFEQGTDYSGNLVPKLQKEKSTYKKSGWFTSEEEAKQDWQLAFNQAMDKLNPALSQLLQLQSDLGVSVSYVMEGDTHGIYEDYLYIGAQVNGYYFKLKVN